MKTEDVRDDIWFKVYQARQQAKMPADQVDAEEICAEIERRVAADEFKLIEIPKNVAKAMKLIRKTNFDYAELGQLLNHSSTVTSEILRVANSALHTGAVATAAKHRDLSRLGEKVLTSILYVGCTRMFGKNKKGLEQITEDIVEHSYAVAHISQYLAQKYCHDADEAFLAGFLHDIGKIAVSVTLPTTQTSSVCINMRPSTSSNTSCNRYTSTSASSS